MSGSIEIPVSFFFSFLSEQIHTDYPYPLDISQIDLTVDRFEGTKYRANLEFAALPATLDTLLPTACANRAPR